MTKMTDCERILLVLEAARGEWVENLYGITRTMVHSRVSELRRRGHQIEMKRFGTKDYRYRLLEGAERQEDANG